MTGPPTAATVSQHGSSAGSRPSSRKTSLTHLLGSAAGSTTSAFSSGTNAGVDADDSAYVYMTIQLYSIEKEFYLVDFKCAGYERLVPRRIVHEEGLDHTDSGSNGSAVDTELVGAGRAAEEKDVSSPFPFLDVASRLIIQLAEAE